MRWGEISQRGLSRLTWLTLSENGRRSPIYKVVAKVAKCVKYFAHLAANFGNVYITYMLANNSVGQHMSYFLSYD